MKYSILFFFLLITLIACNQSDKTASNKSEETSDKIKALNLKLDATEAQLYNVRVELAKCKGDSLPVAK